MFPLYIFHFMCMNFSWWSFCIFFFTFHVHFWWSLCITSRYSHSCNSHCNSFFVGKTEMLITFVGVFESWTFQQSQSQNPNLNWTKIIIILDYYPTLGARLLPQKWFFTKYSNFIMDFFYQKKWSEFMIV